MRGTQCVIAVVVLASGWSQAVTMAQDGSATAIVESLIQQNDGLKDRKIRVIDVSGTPYQRGWAHGQALNVEIVEMINAFKADLTKTYDVDADVFIKRFLAETDFIPAIKKWTPGLIEEVRGISDGSGVPFEDVYVYQLADEIWSMGSWAMKHKCTAIAVNRRDGQPTIVAQNMDIPGFYQKYPTLLRIGQEQGPKKIVLTCPGLIGVNGMNSAGVAVCCNTLLQLKPSRTGVPCLFVVRGVLEQTDLNGAESWLKAIRHAVGQNYTIGDATGARAFECSSSSKVRYSPDENVDFTYHTNHPLVNTDWHPDYLARCKANNRKPEEGLRICHRFEALQKRIKANESITEEIIVDALASKDHSSGPICGSWNYACTVFVLGEKPELHIAPGRADRYRMQTFGFE